MLRYTHTDLSVRVYKHHTHTWTTEHGLLCNHSVTWSMADGQGMMLAQTWSVSSVYAARPSHNGHCLWLQAADNLTACTGFGNITKRDSGHMLACITVTGRYTTNPTMCGGASIMAWGCTTSHGIGGA
jgi:hypothetical protein